MNTQKMLTSGQATVRSSDRQPISRHRIVTFVAMLFCLSASGAAPVVDNREIITRFADLFYLRKDVEKAFMTYVASDYIQHNPGLQDGRDAAIAALKPMFGSADHSFAIERIIVDGNLAAIHIRVISPRPAAVVDLYRLANGKIVEHWDVIQVVPDKSANPHPMF